MRPPRVFQAHLASRPARLSSLRMSNVRCRRTTGSKRYSRFQTLRSLNSIALSARRDRPISSLARTSADQSREVLAQFRIRSCGPRSVPLESARAVTLYAGFVRCWIRQMFGLASSSAKRPSQEGPADRLAAAGTPAASAHASRGMACLGMTGPRAASFRLGRLSPSQRNVSARRGPTYADG